MNLFLLRCPEWLACWTQAQKARVQIAAATLSGNNVRQTVHTLRASVHQVGKLVAALLRVAGVTAGWQKVMAAYHLVYDSITCRLTANNRDQLRNPKLGNRVCATFLLLPMCVEQCC